MHTTAKPVASNAMKESQPSWVNRLGLHFYAIIYAIYSPIFAATFIA